MKKLFLAMLVFTCLSTHKYSYAVTGCQNLARLAEAVMEARQNGASLPDLYSRFEASDTLVRSLIIEAYALPEFSSLEYKLKEVNSFKNKYFLKCVTLAPELDKEIETKEKKLVNDKILRSNFGNNISAVLSKSTCKDDDFKYDGLEYALDSGIPIEKVKNKTDYYYMHKNIAYTVRGCWKYADKEESGIIDVKFRRKHDNKIWQEKLNLNDGTWN